MKFLLSVMIVLLSLSCSEPKSQMVLLTGPNDLTGVYLRERASGACETFFKSKIKMIHSADPAKAVPDELVVFENVTSKQIKFGSGTFESNGTIRIGLGGNPKVECLGSHMLDLVKVNCTQGNAVCQVSLRKQ